MKNIYQIQETIDVSLFQSFGIDLRKALFFDIETTGFSASNTLLYLIGVCYYEEKTNSFQGIQWFNEDGSKEEEILLQFLAFADSFDYLIHYNGEGFDLPYLKEKCNRYHITSCLSFKKSFDIYKQCRGLKSLLPMDHMRQKDVEQFLMIERVDEKSGGELIKVYQQYLLDQSEEKKALLFLHNKDDLTGLIKITPMLSYIQFLSNNYEVTHFTIKNSQAVLTLTLNYSLPKRIAKGKGALIVTATGNTATIRQPIYQGELKYFYPNYKDYYYLPFEDTAMHKSVAFYVDKEFRTQAKAATCYSRKTGMFLPQTEEVVCPYFKKEYNDKVSYFELTTKVCEDPDLLKKYAASLLAALLTS